MFNPYSTNISFNNPLIITGNCIVEYKIPIVKIAANAVENAKHLFFLDFSIYNKILLKE